MRPALLALVAVLATPPVSIAQTAPRPTIVLTILAGTMTGHGLWAIPKQPLSVLNTTNHDTLALSRSIGSSVILGASGTYFVQPAIGLHAELSYLGLPMDTSCQLLPPEQSDFEHKNQQLCDNLRAEGGSGGAITAFVGITLRAASRRTVSPYVRGSIGLVNLSRSTVETVGSFVDVGGTPQDRQVILDSSPRHRSLMLGLAAGFTTPIGPGYHIRIEIRDVITSLDRLTGAADDLAMAPVGSRTYHHLGFAIALDVVLERSRGRRY